MKASLINLGGTDPHQRIKWYCHGCKCDHGVPLPPHRQAWGWNQSLEAPTLTPSVLITSGHYAPGHKGNCWCKFKLEDGKPAPFECVRCHCFVRDGKIEFLTDCSHALAGKTVEMESDQ